MNTPKKSNETLLRPAERDWNIVFLFAAYLLISPAYARGLQYLIRDTLGRQSFYFLFGGLAVAILLALAVWVWRLPREMRLRHGAGLGVSGLLGVYLFASLSNPVEWEHLIKYGFFAVLCFRAIRHSLADFGAFLLAFTLASSVGAIEEMVQWQLPTRVGEVRDVYINAKSAFLGLVTLGLVFQPEELKRLRLESLRIATWGFSALVVLLAVFLQLVHTFGHELNPRDDIRFLSVFTAEELHEVTPEAIQVFMDYLQGDDIHHAQHRLNKLALGGIEACGRPIAYVLEARLHRAEYLRHVRENQPDRAAVEYQLLHEYFGGFSRSFGWALPPEEEQETLRRASEVRKYEFRHPNKELIVTSFTASQMWAGTGLFVLLSWLANLGLGMAPGNGKA